MVLYTVKNGDTLGAIAKRYGVTVASLMKLNSITDPNKIYIGNLLKIK